MNGKNGCCYMIFRNGDTAHAQQVLKRLGVEDCFENTIFFESLNPPLQPADLMSTDKSQILCKPSLEAFEAAIRLANIDILFDDSARNITSGKAIGLHTVIVGSSKPVADVDHALHTINNMKEAIPKIWEGEEEHIDQVIQPAAIGMVVLALISVQVEN
ncbi:hypothetical protein V6N13_004867 [Hibiscus sabdariffa]